MKPLDPSTQSTPEAIAAGQLASQLQQLESELTEASNRCEACANLVRQLQGLRESVMPDTQLIEDVSISLRHANMTLRSRKYRLEEARDNLETYRAALTPLIQSQGVIEAARKLGVNQPRPED